MATLLASVRRLGDEGLTLMRLAGELQSGAPIPMTLAEGVFERAFGLEDQAAKDYLALVVNQSEMNSLATVSHDGAGADAFLVHSMVRYTIQHADPGDTSAQREKLRESAIRALVNVLQDVYDIRNHKRLAMYVAHARYLISQPQTTDQAQLSGLLAAYEDARGNFREALEIVKTALPIQERLLGKDHPQTLTTRYNIASYTGEAGRATEALHLFQQLLPDRERVLGSDHPDTLRTSVTIALYTARTGQAAEAMCLFQQLLPDVERVLGSNHRDTLTTRNNIASNTWRTGQAVEALRLFQQLLPDQERVLGSDHPDALRTRNNIAYVTGEVGRPTEALRLFQQLLPDVERVFGRDHPNTLATRSNIAKYTG